MRAIAYLRVSGLGQVDKDGEVRQLDAVRAFCLNNVLELADTKYEAGVSGTVEGMDRPKFAELLEEIGDGCIVVERLDRLARDLMVQELMLKECRERKIQVFAADQGQLIDLASNSGDPTRKLFRQILGALAEWEKSALVLKLRKARDRKRLQTGRCEGIIPWRLTPEGGKVVIFIKELKNIGKTNAQIVNELNQRGITTRLGKRWTKRAVLNYIQTRKCVVISEKSRQPGLS